MKKIHETERLFLKLFSPEDSSASERFWGDSEVMAESGGPVLPEVLLRVLEGYKRSHIDKGLSVYGVIEKSSGNLIGAAGFNIHDSLEKVELLYHFAKTSWGKGYETEAAGACVQLARKHPEVETIYDSCTPGNAGSIKVLQKAGFQYVETRWFEDTGQEEPYFELAIK